MPVLDLLLKIVAALIGLILVMRWLVFIPYIWFMYDRKILRLKNELDQFRQETRNVPMTLSRLEGQINQKKMSTDEQLEIIETKRRLFLDRVNLFLSISAINRKD